MDLALDGRTAVVDAVLEDLDGTTHVRVTVEDDPGADLWREMGRGFHFTPDELEPIPGTIVAGVGNVFFGDDGFGPAVIEALRQHAHPTTARIEDYGIRGVHLAYDLANHDGRVILVDAIALDAAPGTVVMLSPDEVPDVGPVDGHDLRLPAVLAKARELGGRSPTVVVVGCVPADTDEAIGLSDVVQAAVQPTVNRILAMLQEE